MRCRLLLLAICLFVASTSEAQTWVRTNGPVEDHVFGLCVASNGWLFAVTQRGLNRSTNGGDHWTRPFQFSTPSTQQGRLIIAQNGNIVFSGDSGIYVSTDNGETFLQTNSPGFRAPVAELTMSSSGRIFAARTWAVASDDHGLSWFELDSAFGSVPLQVRTMTASHDTIIAESVVGHDIYWSTNNGEDWSVWGPQLPTTPSSYHIAPDGSWVALTVLDVFRQVDHTDTSTGSWNSIITGEFESDSIFFSFSLPDDGSMFLASLNNLWMGKQFSGWRRVATWSDFEGIVNRVIFDKRNKVYYVAVTGGGVWKTDEPLAEVDHAQSPVELRIFPNPLATSATIRCMLTQPTVLEIDITDNLGRTHMQITEHADAGISEIPIVLNRLPAGSYLVQVRAGEFRETRWIVIAK